MYTLFLFLDELGDLGIAWVGSGFPGGFVSGLSWLFSVTMDLLRKYFLALTTGKESYSVFCLCSYEAYDCSCECCLKPKHSSG